MNTHPLPASSQFSTLIHFLIRKTKPACDSVTFSFLHFLKIQKFEVSLFFF